MIGSKNVFFRFYTLGFKMISEKAVICSLTDPSILGFMNVYEHGDIWFKSKGCVGCSEENRKKCCGNCPFQYMDGCKLHRKNKMHKPYVCMIIPAPDSVLSYCQQEFTCIQGSRKGDVVKVNEVH